MWYTIFDPDFPGNASWAPIPSWPAGVAARNATVTVVGGAAAILFRDVNADVSAAENVWFRRLDSRGVWDAGWQLVPGLSSFQTPGLAAAPDGRTYLVRGLAGVVIELMSRPTGTDSAFTSEGVFATVAEFDPLAGALPRLNLLFVPYLRAGHVPFADGRGYLAAYWNAGQVSDPRTWVDYRGYTSGYISASGNSLMGTQLQVRADGTSTGSFPASDPRHSLAVTLRYNDVALAYSGVLDVGGFAPRIGYAPFSNGTPPASIGMATNVDHNDNLTLRSNMCEAVWWLAYGSNASCVCETFDTALCAPGPQRAQGVECDNFIEP